METLGKNEKQKRTQSEVSVPPMLIVHGIRLNRYQGMDEGFYPGGFKWAAKNGWGGEMFNFQPVNGRCYAHVEVLETSIRIENLGAKKKDDSVDGVLVVWTAPDPSRNGRTIVGWFRNATVHRWRKKPTGKLIKLRTYKGHAAFTYQIEAAESDCFLLLPEERVLTIPPRKLGQKGVPGQKPVFYPARQLEPSAKLLEQRIRQFINTGEAIPLSSGKKSSSGYQPDPERRKEIEEAAINFVKRHFGPKPTGLGYTIVDRQRDNCGYDLYATKGDAILCIEVKGRSGVDVTADFTFNEYETIKLEQTGKFQDGSYRICIVTDALSESHGPMLHHFWCVRPSAEWRNVNGAGKLNLEERIAARGLIE